MLEVVADAMYTNTGEGLHRFVDPVDQEVYLYSQFEVPDSRRVFAVFEQPDLKATFQFTVTAPGDLGGREQLPHARAGRRRRRRSDVDVLAHPDPLELRHRARRRSVRGGVRRAHVERRSRHPARRLTPASR